MEISLYRSVGVGVVAETKPRYAEYINVTPIEKLWKQTPGNIKDNTEDVKGNLKSFRGDNQETKHKVGNTIPAKWKRLGGGNQISAPDVVAGEHVMLYNYVGTDKYFWDDMGREPGLRGKEDVIIGISNVKGGPDGESYDLPTSMYIRYNTHDGFFEINCPANDGESASYNFKFNTKEGKFTIADNKDNDILLDSVKGKLTANIKNEIETTTKKYILNADEIVWNGKTFQGNMDTKMTFQTPLGEFTEDLNVLKLLTTLALVFGAGGGTGNGSLTMNGPLEVNSTTTTNDLVTRGTATGHYPR